MIERRKEALHNTNRLLTAFIEEKVSAGTGVPEKAKQLGMTVSNYQVALRRLRVLGRIAGEMKSGALPKVVNAAPISEREYLDLGDPYSRGVPKRISKKMRASTPVRKILSNPIEIKVEREEVKSPVTVTISGPPDAIVAFFRRVGRA